MTLAERLPHSVAFSHLRCRGFFLGFGLQFSNDLNLRGCQQLFDFRLLLLLFDGIDLLLQLFDLSRVLADDGSNFGLLLSGRDAAHVIGQGELPGFRLGCGWLRSGRFLSLQGESSHSQGGQYAVDQSELFHDASFRRDSRRREQATAPAALFEFRL